MDTSSSEIRQRLKQDFAYYAPRCLKIRPKEGLIVPLAFNKAQAYIHYRVELQKTLTGRVRCLILKGRQQGISTYIEGRFYWLTTHRQGVRAFILTHEVDATNNLFDMAQRYHDYCPPFLKPTADASNSKELDFGALDSGYRLGTANNKGVGRSSTIQFLHGSEVGFWQNAAEHAKGVLQAVPDVADTEVFLESTANGMGNYFHQQWQRAEAGQSDFIPLFVPWYWQPEYVKAIPEDFALQENEDELKYLYNLSDEQLYWRRYKISDLSVSGMDGSKFFMQEYPFTPTEAFQATGEDALITPTIVMRARKTEAEPWGAKLLGVDPARFGDDRTAIIRRQGRVAYKLETYAKRSLMEIAGITHQIIKEEQPNKVYVDVAGLGAGVYDRLKELGHDDILVAVNGGNTPLNQRKYANKRAEMWGEMNEWLHDQPAQVPDLDDLHSDLCGVQYKIDSKGRIVLEKKEDMKKRGLRSPDCGDALALTFAYPASAVNPERQKNDNTVAKHMMANYTKVDKLKKAAYK
jgi:hypothetical protein